ncbi:hypothetical protein ACSBR2_009076 [Camellia fascicularis]
MCKFAASTGCTWNPRIGSDLVADVVANRVHAQPLTRFTDVIFDLKNDYELDISCRLTWLVVEKAMGEVYGDHALSFDQLRWYSDVVMENNPNSYINLEFEQGTGRFVRHFISFRACINGFKHCRPLLFLDGTFLKGRFKGTLLVATTKDGNQDQMKYVNAEHKIGFMRKLRECAYAPMTTSLHNKIEVLKLCSLAIVGEFLKDLQPKHWDVAYLRALYFESIYPILTVEKPTVMPNDYLIAPPAIKCPPGKPKWKRIPSMGEVMLRIQCSRYGKMGNHNRKTLDKLAFSMVRDGQPRGVGSCEIPKGGAFDGVSTSTSSAMPMLTDPTGIIGSSFDFVDPRTVLTATV